MSNAGFKESPFLYCDSWGPNYTCSKCGRKIIGLELCPNHDCEGWVPERPGQCAEMVCPLHPERNPHQKEGV